MSHIHRLAALAGAALLGLAATPAVRAQTAYAISNGGDTLIRFDLSTPGSLATVGAFSGDVGRLDGLDFRPSNGLLYGYDTITNHIVTIDLATAATTFVSMPTTGSNTFDLGLDFDPATDSLRMGTTQNQNLRINPDTGATLVEGPLAYAVGDPNAGINPFVDEAAYTSASGTGTRLFYIDYSLDTLVTTADPSNGVLTTVGSLGVDTDAITGFDILTDANGVNTAYALLNVSFTPGIYTISLDTGAATLLNELTGDNSVFFPYSLAVAPAAPAVPEPGSFALLAGMGIVGAGFLRRRKTARKAA